MMPKGVDHFRRGRLEEEVVVVQKSLMPKGVDHTSFAPSETCPDGAKIFDAERR